MSQCFDIAQLLAALLKLIERFKFQWIAILSTSGLA
jgi:hypothetical protein